MNRRWSGARRWAWRIVKIAAVTSVVVGIVYWVRFSPVPVAVHTVERGQIIAEVMGTGTLEARVSTTIGPKISGRISVVLVDQGDRVSAGDLLLRLDDEELQQQVAIAQANVEASAAAIERLKTDKNRASAVFAQARKSHARIELLSQRSAASQDELDRATESLAVAVAGVSRAEAGITEGQKELVAAEKTLEYHRARLKDTQINAPFDGLIVKRSREPGDVVVPGSAVLTLISTDELWISAWVDETEIARLEPGQPARAVFRSEPDRSYHGNVVRMGKEADRETRELIVDVRVLELPTNWAIGQRAETFIEVARNDEATTLPAKLILIRDGETGVFVDIEGQAAWRAVSIGLRNRETVEVLEGLQPKDLVIVPTDDRTSLHDGRRVVKW